MNSTQSPPPDIVAGMVRPQPYVEWMNSPVHESGAQPVPHSWYPVLQVKSQTPPTQARVAFAGAGGHGLQLVPQLSGLVSDQQFIPQAWKPELQRTPQLVPSQVASPFEGG